MERRELRSQGHRQDSQAHHHLEHPGRHLLIVGLLATGFAAELTTDVREPLVALVDEQFRRSYRSGWRYSSSGAVFGSLGGLGALGRESTGVSLGMLAGGVGQITTSQYQLSAARRRHASFLANLAEAEGNARAIEELAVSARMDADRQARQNALAVGAWGALFATGLTVFATDPDFQGGVGLGVAVSSIAGLVHHGTRWRAANRFAADFDTLRRPVPTFVPPPRR